MKKGNGFLSSTFFGDTVVRVICLVEELKAFLILLSGDRRGRGRFERAHSQARAEPRPGSVDRVL